MTSQELLEDLYAASLVIGSNGIDYKISKLQWKSGADNYGCGDMSFRLGSFEIGLPKVISKKESICIFEKRQDAEIFISGARAAEILKDF